MLDTHILLYMSHIICCFCVSFFSLLLLPLRLSLLFIICRSNCRGSFFLMLYFLYSFHGVHTAAVVVAEYIMFIKILRLCFLYSPIPFSIPSTTPAWQLFSSHIYFLCHSTSMNIQSHRAIVCFRFVVFHIGENSSLHCPCGCCYNNILSVSHTTSYIYTLCVIYIWKD